jgi:hypothetical protein
VTKEVAGHSYFKVKLFKKTKIAMRISGVLGSDELYYRYE